MECKKIQSFFLYCIDCLKSKGYYFCNITQMTINTISDICNITYGKYMNRPMSKIERQRIFNFAKNPSLINTFDRSKNHPFIRKYPHIPFNN